MRDETCCLFGMLGMMLIAISVWGDDPVTLIDDTVKAMRQRRLGR